ncbi:MAG: sensor histidine kinase [Alphaproteobacteria bacterium]|nr:sensor histidine kinase [Alphaproteobacteria bacterium]
MAEQEATRARRPGLGQRLGVRLYLALVASLVVAAFLFGMAHMRYGARAISLGAGTHFAMLMLLVAIALAVAAAAYPVVRRLTRRLERLQASVEAWGKGDLSARVPVQGRDEVALLAISFNESAARVEALMGAQKTLLANASHELRSPLTRIRMAVELIEEQAPAALRQELARNIAELDQLIGEVLLASRLDAVSEHAPVDVDLSALVAEECARTGADCHAEAIEISGDPALLRRMIRNLLENAGRHGGGTPIVVALTLDPPASVRLEVRDGGPGVPEAEREAIFAPFYRLRGTSEADGGYGLGLSLVRQIAQRHGGGAHCLASPGGGAVFQVTLPLRAD